MRDPRDADTPLENALRPQDDCEGHARVADARRRAACFPGWIVVTRARLFAPPEKDRRSFPGGGGPNRFAIYVLVRAPDLTRTGLSGWHTPCHLPPP